MSRATTLRGAARSAQVPLSSGPAGVDVTEPVRRRSPRGDATRARILEDARKIFAEHGYRGSSINEIAKAAGITMPGLLHHFPSKDALFAAVMREHDLKDTAYFDEQLLSGAGGFEGASVYEVLDGFVSTARINRDRRSFVRLSHVNSAESSSGEHPGAVVSLEHYRKARQLVSTALRRSLADGSARTGVDPDVMAAQVVAMIEGLENQWLHDENLDFEGIFAAWVEQVKAQLRP